jgi:phosphate/sulfate permease
MNFVVLSVAVITALASIGVAAWSWRVMTSLGDELLDLAGFSPMRGED